MAFKALSISMSPDADPRKHRSEIETGKYQLFSVVVKNPAEAAEVCREFVEQRSIHSVLLCPGFTNSDVADISKSVGPGVGVCVARGDGPSGKIAMEAMQKAGFF
jgi:hypothetical protein